MHNMAMSCATTAYIVEPNYVVNAKGKIGENPQEKIKFKESMDKTISFHLLKP